MYASIQTVWDLLSTANETTNIYTSIDILTDAQTTNDSIDYSDKINSYSEKGGYSPTYLSAFSVAAFAEAIQEAFQTLNVFTSIIGFITAIAGGMAIITTNLQNVSARMKEFAILKSTGWKNKHIFLDVIYESIILGLIGAGIGLGLGSFLIFLLSSGFSPFGSTSALIKVAGIIQVFVYALGLGIVGGLYPAIKAARVKPVKVLKGG